jgi:hypothetical protein
MGVSVMTESLLSDERMDELEGVLSVFSFGMLRDFLTFMVVCERERIDMQEVPKFLRQRAARRHEFILQAEEKMAEIAEKAPVCDVCGNVLSLEDVNDRKSRMVDDHSKSWWVCPDPECLFDPVTSDKYIHEVVADLGVSATEFFKESKRRQEKDIIEKRKKKEMDKKRISESLTPLSKEQITGKPIVNAKNV